MPESHRTWCNVSLSALRSNLRTLQRTASRGTRVLAVVKDNADACLVRQSEILSRPTVWTTDSDFTIYRRHRRLLIPLLTPKSSP